MKDMNDKIRGKVNRRHRIQQLELESKSICCLYYYLRDSAGEIWITVCLLGHKSSDPLDSWVWSRGTAIRSQLDRIDKKRGRNIAHGRAIAAKMFLPNIGVKRELYRIDRMEVNRIFSKVFQPYGPNDLNYFANYEVVRYKSVNPATFTSFERDLVWKALVKYEETNREK